MSSGMHMPVVLMTGAMRGVGLAIAAKFSQEGAKIAILVKDDQSEDCQKIKNDLSSLGSEVALIKADIRSEEDVALVILL